MLALLQIMFIPSLLNTNMFKYDIVSSSCILLYFLQARKEVEHAMRLNPNKKLLQKELLATSGKSNRLFTAIYAISFMLFIFMIVQRNIVGDHSL